MEKCCINNIFKKNLCIFSKIISVILYNKESNISKSRLKILLGSYPDDLNSQIT